MSNYAIFIHVDIYTNTKMTCICSEDSWVLDVSDIHHLLYCQSTTQMHTDEFIFDLALSVQCVIPDVTVVRLVCILTDTAPPQCPPWCCQYFCEGIL